ncbi:ankyrin repeat domain-containing protein [Hymenobacter glacialis]|uniref:ankyrin repeat domain-containing protein n=1 Tax=Hymenobacter glacialis TaxID=1908236 RepID=UPI001301611C|nr:ankyrin repeat domain-containing protein [Hymenobacter glacialis]
MPSKTPGQRLSDEAIRAMHQKDFDVLESLLTPYTVDLKDGSGRALLSKMVVFGDAHMIEWMLAKQPSLDISDNNGWTALHFAAQSHDVEVAKKLLRAGATVDTQDSYGNTPLWRATFESRGRGEMIKFLLANGANATLKNHSGSSPLELANTIANFDVKQFFPV